MDIESCGWKYRILIEVYLEHVHSLNSLSVGVDSHFVGIDNFG